MFFLLNEYEIVIIKFKMSNITAEAVTKNMEGEKRND